MSGLGIFLFVLALLLMILLHEAAHFGAAKAFGIKVEEFFVGFGPRLWSIKRGETEYGVKAIPAGGYVRIAGMNPFQEAPPEDRDRVFGAKPAWQRAIVLAGGSATHFLLALIFLAVFFAAVGVPRFGPPLVGRVEPRLNGQPSPAAEAELERGDAIVAVDGMRVESNEELVELTREHVGETIRLTVVRDGERRTVPVTPVLSEVEGERVGRLGIVLTQEVVGRERSGPFGAVGKAATTTGEITVRSVEALGEVFSPSGLARIGRLLVGEAERGVRDVTGIVGAGRLAGQAVSSGNLGTLLILLAGLNVFVGIINILPLPPLDGGHLAVLAWEKVTGRSVDLRKLIPITAAVAGLLILLMISLTYLDLVEPIPNPFE